MKRIRAQTLDKALEKVRRECGDDALLIETRATRDGYLVVAANPGTLASDASARLARKPGPNRPRTPRWTRGFEDLAQAAMEFGISTRLLHAVENALLGTRVNLSRPGDPAVPGLAARVLKSLIQTEDRIEGEVEGASFRTIALVGPTGVGKTTTLAKLAARAVHDHQQRVAIITQDTYRVAAVEQLRAFADMLEVPLEVAFTPTDLRRAVSRHPDADRIFIDTTGRGPFDMESIGLLTGTLGSVSPTTVLCLPAATRRVDAEAALRGFDRLAIDGIAFTKWDETEVPGEALSIVVERGIPISHVTVGQDVPDDILPACAASLAASAFNIDHRIAETLL